MRYSASPLRTKATSIMMKSLDTAEEDLNHDWQGGKRRVWIMAMFLGTMFLYAARSAVPLCMAAMSKDMAWDKEADGAVMSAFFWGYTPAQIIGGWLSDKYGGELVLGYAGIVWSLCTMIVPFLPAGPILFFPPIAVMVISRVFTGLSQGLHYPSLTNIIVKRIPLKERSLFTSSIFSAGPVGTLLMGSAGSVVLILFGWHSVFLLQGLVGLTWAWLWRYYAAGGQYTPTSKTSKRTELSIGNIKMMEATASEKAAQVSVPYCTFFKHPGVWAIIISQFCQAGAFWNLFSWLPLYFEEVYPNSKKWIFNVLPWLVFFPFSTIAGLLADRMIKSGWSVTFVRKFFQTFSMCGAGLCMLLFDWVSTFSQAMVLIMITMACNSMGNCGTPVTPQDMAPKFAGSLFGLMNSAGAFSGIVIVPICGHILEITHKWSSIFHINAAILMFGAAVFLIFGTAKKII